MVFRPPLLESLGSEGLSGLSPSVSKLHQDGYSATGGDEVDGLWRPVATRLFLTAGKSLGIVTPRDLGALPCLRKTACRARTDGVTEVGRANGPASLTLHCRVNANVSSSSASAARRLAVSPQPLLREGRRLQHRRRNPATATPGCGSSTATRASDLPSSRHMRPACAFGCWGPNTRPRRPSCASPLSARVHRVIVYAVVDDALSPLLARDGSGLDPTLVPRPTRESLM